MDDKLVFPIQFDIESGLEDALSKAGDVSKRLQLAFNRKYAIQIEVDDADAIRKIDDLRKKLQELQTELVNFGKGAASGIVGPLEDADSKAAELKNRLAAVTDELVKAGEAAKEQVKNYREAMEAAEKITQAKEAATQAAKNEKSEEEKLLEAQQRLQEMLEAEENTINAISKKLGYHSQAIRDMEMDSDAWEMTALEIRRLSEELEAANRRLRDFQQASFRGLNEIVTAEQVAKLTQLRQQVAEIDAYLNERRANNTLYDSNGALNWSVTQELEKRKRLTSEINEMIKTGAQMQLEYEKQITAEKEKHLRQTAVDNPDSAIGAADNIAEMQKLLSIYRQELAKTEVGTEMFDKISAAIAQVSQKITEANESLKAFQNDALKGIDSDSIIRLGKELYTIRERIQQIDAEFNALRANGGAYDDNDGLTEEANNLIRERLELTKIIADRTRTAAQEQLKMERQINAEEKKRQQAIEQQKRREDEIKKTLQLQENSLENITKKLQAQQQILRKSELGSDEYRDAAAEVERLSAALKAAQAQTDLLTGKAEKGGQKVSAVYREHSSYLKRLIQRMTIYFSIHQIGSFLSKVREVTAEFELQRKSLGALLQSQSKADELFAQIKRYATQTPIKLLDLTTYIKQVAAYRIEYNKLFDTTKRLADVSVGLGVDMQRIVLAYGQVKAASFLRASEVRQFTEAGIPMLELLAEKFSELQNRVVSTSDVMNLIQRRMVDFGMVEQVFKDITSEGGMFFEMQEKQANTLYGMWSKLGDAVSIMYDKIGNNEGVNWAMKALISLLELLVKNFGQIARVVGYTTAAYLVGAAITKMYAVSQSRVEKALQRTAAAQAQLTAAQTLNSKVAMRQAKWNLAAALSFEKAAKSTNVLKTAMFGLKGAFQKLIAFVSGNIWGVALAGLFAIVAVIENIIETANKFNNILSRNQQEYSSKVAESVSNFNALADAIVKATDGSAEQKKMLDELHRTYGDMIPVQDMTIERLREMNGNYEGLTKNIEAYIAAEQKKKTIEEVRQEFADDLAGLRKDALDEAGSYKNVMRSIMTKLEVAFANGASQDEIIKLMNEVYSFGISADAMKAFGKYMDKLEEMYEQIGIVKDAFDELAPPVFDSRIDAFIKANEAEAEAYEGLVKSEWLREKNLQSLVQSLKDAWADYKDRVSQTEDGAEKVKMLEEYETKLFSDEIIQTAENALDDIIAGKFVKNTKIRFLALKAGISGLSAELDQIVAVAERYYNTLVPSDEVVDLFKEKLWTMADAAGVSMSRLQMIIWNGQGSIKDYAKTVEEEIEQLEQDLKKAEGKMANGLGGFLDTGEASVSGRARLNLLREYLEFVKQFFKEQDNDNNKGIDDRLSKLKEMEQALGQMYSKYQQLKQAQGEVFADDNIKTLYKDQIDYLNGLAKEFGMKEFEIPKTLKQLNEYRRQIKNMIETLRLNGFEKEALQIEMTIGSANVDEIVDNIKKELNRIAQELKQAQVAEKFYNEILYATGDYDLAQTIATSIYDLSGLDAQSLLVAQVKTILRNAKISEDVIKNIISGNQIDFAELINVANVNKDDLGESYSQLIDIANSGQAQLAKIYQTYIKDLEKAKTYSQQLVDLARYTSRQINSINNDPNLSDEQKAQFVQGYERRQQRMQANIEWEAFKNMPMYVQLFSDLNNASTTMLENMRRRLEDLKKVWGEALDPTALKDIQKQVENLNKELASRNPFTALRDSWRDYRKLRKDGSMEDAERRLTLANERHAQAAADLATALQDEAIAQKNYDAAVAEFGASSLNAQAFYDILVASQAVTKQAQERVDKTEEEVNAAQELLDTWKRIKQALGLAFEGVMSWGEVLSAFAQSTASVVETLGVSDEDVQYFKDLAEGVDLITKSGSDLVKAFKETDIKGMVQATIVAIPNMVAGFTKIFNAGKIRAANKEIAKQEKIISQLEYSYNRLQAAADKLFGADYISNYNRQMAILQAQQAAYLAQAEAERSKGKAKDQDAIDGYLDKAREIGDEIADMQDQLAQKFTDTTMTDAAKDFATAWLEAKASFASTTTAIKEKYRDLIKNLIIEGAAAKVIENALQPMWDKLNELLVGGDVTGAMQWLSQSMDSFVQQANDGMNVLWKSLEQAGIDVQKAFNGDNGVTGISREIASASEESINGLAQGINTQNYYISYVPQIAQEVAAIRVALQGGGQASSAAAGWTDWQTQAMGHYAEIQRNTAETALRCEKAASACQEVADRLRRVVESKKSAIRTTIV